jgi:hypothetical protein
VDIGDANNDSSRRALSYKRRIAFLCEAKKLEVLEDRILDFKYIEVIVYEEGRPDIDAFSIGISALLLHDNVLELKGTPDYLVRRIPSNTAINKKDVINTKFSILL